jgi:hypothetical protein
LICRLAYTRSSHRNGSLVYFIAGRYVHHQRDRRTAKMVHAESVDRRTLIGHHDATVANLNFSMGHMPRIISHAKSFGGAKHFHIKSDGCGRLLKNQVGLDAVVAGGSARILLIHETFIDRSRAQVHPGADRRGAASVPGHGRTEPALFSPDPRMRFSLPRFAVWWMILPHGTTPSLRSPPHA